MMDFARTLAGGDRPTHIAVNGWMAGRLSTGSGQYLDHLLAWLPGLAADVRISLLLPARFGEASAQQCRLRWPQVEVTSVGVPRLPENLAKVWWEQIAAPAAASRLGAQVYWAPYWAAPYHSPLPTVVTIHDLIPLLLPAYRGGFLQRRYTQLVSWTARRASAIIAVSVAAQRDIVAHLHVPPERVHVVHHGPNQEGYGAVAAADMARVRVRYRLPEHFFLYLGGFDVRKNMGRLLRGYARYLQSGGDPAIQLVLAGALPAKDSAFFPDPLRLADEAGCAEQVHCCGWVDEADKPALYALATAFVFPSEYEGFGMMVLEAMQAGTPVITSQEMRG